MTTEIKNVNGMTIQEATKYYSTLGIVTHPLKGKKTKLQNWLRHIEDFGKCSNINRQIKDKMGYNLLRLHQRCS
jgi:hypothetical protein